MNRARLAESAKQSILIIGDSQADADTLATTVSTHIGIEVDLHTLTELSALEKALLARSWDVVLCPVALTRLAPVAAVQWIAIAQPKAALILMAATVPAQDAVDLMRLGAHGFVETGDLRRFAEVIRRKLMASRAHVPDPHAQGESERYRQALLTALPDHILTIALDGTVVDIQGPADRLPYPPASLIGRTLPELMPARLARRWMEAIAQVTATRELVTFQYILPIQEELHAFEVRIVPLDSDRVLAIVREVTERKRIEAALRTSEELYHTLLESSDAAISMVDRDGVYRYLNGIAARPHGALPDELLGRTVCDLFSPADAAAILADVNRVIDQRRGMVQETQVTIAGHLRWFHTSTQPVNDALRQRRRGARLRPHAGAVRRQADGGAVSAGCCHQAARGGSRRH